MDGGSAGGERGSKPDGVALEDRRSVVMGGFRSFCPVFFLSGLEKERGEPPASAR